MTMNDQSTENSHIQVTIKTAWYILARLISLTVLIISNLFSYRQLIHRKSINYVQFLLKFKIVFRMMIDRDYIFS